ncbi:CD2 antigen cytoplasmic tail-binding 2 [Chlorella sorokiniana]|uniref:CD2 antigen cytoplasmic tail-binding 2 n=1 Tax=Chlorella sorokiniana TaxID=3076 RepID=A0A2P6U2U5_CHLSO|nr:CD2 antigen cytoplasmic tail-binding 2 [Chlorella sorokiniana]|eukprot:PRW60637.1 CD2 antigen cytoplasmic tail-binding 2 [Chlorella sorokiniana]
MADTDALIQQALKEEEAERKRAKKEKAAQAKETKAARKGKTLEQIEDEEGGPVKESQVGMAQTRRAAKRKGTGVDDTELVEDVEAVEEDLEHEEEDGIKLEAFNLKEEREKGYFDDAGNYVEREDKDEAELAQDAWLQSDEAKVVSEEVRRKIEERQRREAAAEAAGPLSATQIARLQFAASQLLQPGETVAAGLKRLGGHSRRPAKRSKTRGGEAADMAADVAPDPAAKEQFNKLTEVAMQLMDAGEADVYTQNKEYFERAAAVYIDLPGPSKVLEGGAGKAAYEDADEDMFAEDDDKPKEPAAAAPAAAAPAAAPAAAAPAAAAPPRAAAPARQQQADETDYSSWPVKELRRFLTERGVDSAGIIEKDDLIAKVKEVAASGPEGEAPAGYTFDAATGYWHSPETGMYWDASSGGFYNPADTKWYSWDGDKQQFVEWAAGGPQ